MKFFSDYRPDMARELKKGDVIRLGLKDATVERTSFLSDHFVSLDRYPTACALKVEFSDHEAIVVHPSHAVRRMPV